MRKPARNLDEQLKLLDERGMIVPSRQADSLAREHARQFLLDNNYYRLSGYWRSFQKAPREGDNTFDPPVPWEKIQQAYALDQDIRYLLFYGLGQIEIAFRSRLAYFWALTESGPYAYLDPESYVRRVNSGPRHRNYPRNVVKAVEDELKYSKDPSIVHFRSAGEAVPIWAAVEVLSFGRVSKMYRLLEDQVVQSDVADSFLLPGIRFTASVFHSLSTLRNACAHHARIWNRVPDLPIPVLKKLKVGPDKSIYEQTPWGWFVMVTYLVQQLEGDDSFGASLAALLDAHPELIQGYQKPRND